MSIRATFIAIITALAAAVALASPASADTLRVGSHAWTNKALIVREGPGAEYQVIGDVAGEIEVKVLRCLRTWCLIERVGAPKDGWVKISHLNFGTKPGYLLDDVFDDQIYAIVGGEGKVCFHTGTNYSGEAYCAESGESSFDLVLQGYDNQFASISIEGRHYVEVCTGIELSSYCTRLTKSYPNLNKYLHRSISSFWVH